MKRLSIVVPVWNEEKTLAQLVDKVQSVEFPNGIEKEVILIDDKSSDNTLGVFEELKKKYSNITTYGNEVNKGKSQTVKAGVTKSTGDFVIIQDADLEYEPSDIIELIKLQEDQNLDVVYGDRFGKDNKVIYWENYIGNKVLSSISNLFTYPRLRVWIPDMEVCYKLIRGNVARDIGAGIVSVSRFGIEPEITAKLSRYKSNGQHLKFGIVPIHYNPRSMAEGKHMQAFHDGFKALKEIFRFNIL